MLRSVVLSLLPAVARGEFDDSGFLGWLADELTDVDMATLKFDGEIPAYIKGTFVQSGPGRFGMGNVRVGHAFDGYSKTHRVVFENDGTVSFSSRFLQSAFLKKSLKQNTMVPSIFVGETDPPTRVPNGPKNVITGANDNNYIKSHKFGDVEFILSDTSIATQMSNDFQNLTHVIRPEIMGMGTPGVSWTDNLDPIDTTGHICALGTMAHGGVDPTTGFFIGAVGCDGMVGTHLEHSYHVLFQIDPRQPRKRHVIASIPLPHGRPASSMHAMAHTQNHVVLIAQPLHASTTGLLAGKPLGEGGIVLGNGTIFQAVNRHDGTVREFHYDSLQFAHVVNSWEEGDDIVLDVTWYQHDWHMNFFGQFMMKNLESKSVRDAWPLGKMKRYRLRADGSVQETVLLADEPNTQFELVKVNENKQGQAEHCVFFGLQFCSNAYDESPNSTKVGPAMALGMGKRNLCTGERNGIYAPNEYPAEVEFIPNPAGTDEDDGALLGIVFDANRKSSYFHIVDAKTMKEVARAPLPVRVPFPVHSSFYPSTTQSVV